MKKEILSWVSFWLLLIVLSSVLWWFLAYGPNFFAGLF